MADKNAWIGAFAPAKINLTLHVTSKDENGFHILDSLVAFADIGDKLILRPASQTSLSVDGPMAKGVPEDSTNLVWRATNFCKVPPTQIILTKYLPRASGIGGGSSDAATAIRALCTQFHRPLPDPTSTTTLGSDLPVCLSPRPTRMQGLGERLSPYLALPELISS